MRTAPTVVPFPGPLAYRAARTRELAVLCRLTPDLGGFDRDLVVDGRIRVLTRNAVPLGVIGWTEHGAGRVVLRAWSVVPAERGQGHGRHLFDAAFAELRAAGHRWIDADAPREAVARLVRRGFRALGPAPFFVDGRPLRGVWMTRALERPPALSLV